MPRSPIRSGGSASSLTTSAPDRPMRSTSRTCAPCSMACTPSSGCTPRKRMKATCHWATTQQAYRSRPAAPLRTATSRGPGPAFGPLLDAQQHLAGHHEGYRFHGPGGQAGGTPREGRAAPRNEPTPARAERDDVERPYGVPRLLGRLLTQHDGPAGVDPRDRQCEAILAAQPALPHQAHLIAGIEALPFLADPVGAVDTQADDVLQPVIAVHAAPVLAALHQPAPHLLRGSVDGDR